MCAHAQDIPSWHFCQTMDGFLLDCETAELLKRYETAKNSPLSFLSLPVPVQYGITETEKRTFHILSLSAIISGVALKHIKLFVVLILSFTHEAQPNYR